MVKGYAEGETVPKTKRDKLKIGLKKFQEARRKFYTEYYPEFQRQVQEAQKQFPTTSSLIGFEEASREETTIGLEAERRRRKKKKKSVADVLLG